MSVVTMASASDCSANTCTGGGGGGGGGNGGATSAARAAASFSSILPLAMARSLLRRNHLDAGHQQRGRTFEFDLRGS